MLQNIWNILYKLITGQKITWNTILMYTLLCVITVGTTYWVKAIEDIKVEQSQASETIDKLKNILSSDKGEINFFSKQNIEIDRKMHDIVVSLRSELKSDWVLLWGFHNGTKIGTIHLKKISVIDESSAIGKQLHASNLQNLPMNLFVNSLIPIWNGYTVFRFTSEMDDRNFITLLEQNGIFLEISTPIFIEGIAYPVGILGVYYGDSKTEFYKKKENKDKIEYIVKRLEKSGWDISLILSTEYQKSLTTN